MSNFAHLSGKRTLAEWLPATLEVLEIVGYEQDSDPMANQILEVIEKREQLLPNLRVLSGIEEKIENGQEFYGHQDDFVRSDASSDEENAEV